MIVTSDIDDGGQVEQNIRYNFELNNISTVTHIAHTWGTGWDFSIKDHNHNDCCASSFKYIIASDILLYVKVYPDLVKTLCELFDGGSIEKFVMSWKRRINESKIFFDLMKQAGFDLEKPENQNGTIFIFTKLN